MQKLTSTIEGLILGTSKERWPGKAPSAIAKHSVSVSVHLTQTGFAGDEQADLKVHGGVEKAVHHYPADHYPFWANRYGELPVFQSGGFGENITTTGVTENTVCIGDIFQLGSATVQVSQGRQPCWKLNKHTSIPKMAFDFQKTAKTGWYYRVLEEGEVRVGQEVRLLERLHPYWTVEYVTRARLDRNISTDVAMALAELPELASGWRSAFERKTSRDFEQDTSARLGT